MLPVNETLTLGISCRLCCSRSSCVAAIGCDYLLDCTLFVNIKPNKTSKHENQIETYQSALSSVKNAYSEVSV